MEKFSQFRDRGSGIAPFIPHTPPSSIAAKLLHLTLFTFRLPFLLFYATVYFVLLHPIRSLLPQALNKLLVWGLLAIPQIWWADLQLDGVKRGSLSQQPPHRMPGAPPANIIAASFTSPIDAVYLAAVFDPIFTISYPGSRQVARVGLWGAIWHALSPAQLRPDPPDTAGLVDLGELTARHPDRVVAVFPECVTTNGQGIMPFSPSLLTAPASVKIFPVSIRYSAPDITTPVPGAWTTFLWRLLSRPTHAMRIRIAEAVHNTSGAVNGIAEASGSDTAPRPGRSRADAVSEPTALTLEEQLLLDRVAENLARLGRNKRVGLTVEDKASFVRAWKRK